MIPAFMVLGTAIGPGLCGWLIDLGIDLPEQAPGISACLLVVNPTAWWCDPF